LRDKEIARKIPKKAVNKAGVSIFTQLIKSRIPKFYEP